MKIQFAIKIRWLIPVFILLILIGYQNCGEVSLQHVSAPLPLVFKTSLSGKVCVSQNSQINNFTLSRIYAVNVTSRLTNGRLLADSDADGIPDVEEEASPLNLDPLNPRTHGILDSICLSQGGLSCNIIPGMCDPSQQIATGINDCDVVSTPSSNYRGINSDAKELRHNADLVPDYLEIIRGSSRVTADADLDNDGDSLTNDKEIRLGRDINFPDDGNIDPQYLMQVSYAPGETLSECHGNQSYNLSINPPLLPVQAYQNPGDPLSHQKNENVILVYLVSEAPTGETEYWIAVKKIMLGGQEESQMTLTPSDFVLDGAYSR